jgi:hypothetical protein
MSDPTQDRLDAAWKAWIDAQQAAIETVRTAEGVPRTETDVAEGYRWITRLASLAQEWFIEKSDPLHPQLFQSQTEYRKRGGVRRAHLRHAGRQGPGRRADRHHGPGPRRPVRSGAQR